MRLLHIKQHCSLGNCQVHPPEYAWLFETGKKTLESEIILSMEDPPNTLPRSSY